MDHLPVVALACPAEELTSAAYLAGVPIVHKMAEHPHFFATVAVYRPRARITAVACNTRTPAAHATSDGECSKSDEGVASGTDSDEDWG